MFFVYTINAVHPETQAPVEYYFYASYRNAYLDIDGTIAKPNKNVFGSFDHWCWIDDVRYDGHESYEDFYEDFISKQLETCTYETSIVKE